MNIFSCPKSYSTLKCLCLHFYKINLPYVSIPFDTVLLPDSSNADGYSLNSFIFSLINKEGLVPFKSMVKYPQNAIYRGSSYGPVFGSGHGILISNNANSNTDSRTDFSNHHYHVPSEVQNRKTILAGSYRLQVFHLTWVTWHGEQMISDGVHVFFYHRNDLCLSSREFFKTPPDTGWYGSLFGNFLVVSYWNGYLISRREFDANFDRCKAIMLTEWLQLKKKPKNLFWVPYIDHVESKSYFRLLCYTDDLHPSRQNELNDWLVLKYSRTKIKRRVPMGPWVSRLTVKRPISLRCS